MSIYSVDLDNQSSVLAVGTNRRVYVVFTAQVIPLWTQVLRYFLRRRQGYDVTYTHTFIVLVDMVEEVFTVYEMCWEDGCSVTTFEYDGVMYNGSTNELNITTTAYNGSSYVSSYCAVDVTLLTMGQDVDYNYYTSYTDVRITPWTLIQHLRPTLNKLTWTCSGFVQALLGMPKYEAFTNPLTPDQLWSKLLATL